MDGRENNILRWILNRLGVRVWSGLNRLWIESTVTGSCQHDDKSWVSVKDGKFPAFQGVFCSMDLVRLSYTHLLCCLRKRYKPETCNG